MGRFVYLQKLSQYPTGDSKGRPFIYVFSYVPVDLAPGRGDLTFSRVFQNINFFLWVDSSTLNLAKHSEGEYDINSKAGKRISFTWKMQKKLPLTPFSNIFFSLRGNLGCYAFGENSPNAVLISFAKWSVLLRACLTMIRKRGVCPRSIMFVACDKWRAVSRRAIRTVSPKHD